MYMYLVVLFMMVFSGAKVVVVCCFLVHFTLVADFILIQAASPSVVSFVLIAQAITVEPLINGHFGDKDFCPLQGVCYWECLT